jgi:hypothetical protein
LVELLASVLTAGHIGLLLDSDIENVRRKMKIHPTIGAACHGTPSAAKDLLQELWGLSIDGAELRARRATASQGDSLDPLSPDRGNNL